MTQSDVRHGCDVYPHVVGKALDGLDAMSTDAAPSDWMQLHIAAEVAAIDAAPEPKVQPLDVAQWQLSPWAKWVAADDGGVVWEYKSQPVILAGNHIKRWWPSDGWAKAIGTIDLTGIDWRRTLTPVNVEPARGILPGSTETEKS